MNASLTAAIPAVDPIFARAEFFFDLEQMELSLTVPQAKQLACSAPKF